MNSKHAFLALSVFTLVSIAHGEREVFAPTKLAPVVDAGTIRLDNGTAGVPSLSFKSDTDTGLYRNNANNLSLTTNAVGKFHVTASTTPTVTIGDEPTISSIPLSGILRATSGSGTNIAGGNLTIQGGNSTGNAAGGYVAFQTAAAGAAGATNNTLTERMRITADGDVGIGVGPNNRLNLTYNGASGVATVGPNSTSGNTALTLGTSSSGTYAERMRIDSAGRMLVNHTASVNVGAGAGQVQVSGVDGNSALQSIARYSADGSGPTLAFGKSRNATIGGQTAVANGDRIGLIAFAGSDGNDMDNNGGAGIQSSVDGAVSTGNVPSRLEFITTAAGGSQTERMRIDSAGNVGIGTTTNLSTLTINGPIAPKGPTDVNAATYTVATTDSSLRFTTTNCTVTLPAAASFPGRILWLNTVTANSVTSNASNVIPLGSNTAGTAIFAATAGKFAMIQSNGTNWVTMMSN